MRLLVQHHRDGDLHNLAEQSQQRALYKTKCQAKVHQGLLLDRDIVLLHRINFFDEAPVQQEHHEFQVQEALTHFGPP